MAIIYGMKKQTPKDILKKIREQKSAYKKTNHTFSLNVTVMERFKEKCEKEAVSMASVVEEMIRNFIEN